MSRPSKIDLAGRRLEQPHDAAPHRRLAAARLADHAERLALADGERDVVDCLHRADLLLEDDAARHREVLLQVLDDEQLLAEAAVLRSRPRPQRPRRRSGRRLRLAGPAVSLTRRPSPRRIAARFAAQASTRVCSSRWQRKGGRAPWKSSSAGSSLAADVHRELAARVERAARRRPQQRRRLAGDLLQALLDHVHPRQRAEQPPRVRHLRPVEELVDARALDDAAAVHDEHLARELGDDAEVVRDHDDRHVELALQVLHQVEDLRLRRHVERGRRLVGDQDLGVVDQRHRDHHALPHAARELVRVVVDALVGARDLRRARGCRSRAGVRPCG